MKRPRNELSIGERIGDDIVWTRIGTVDFPRERRAVSVKITYANDEVQYVEVYPRPGQSDEDAALDALEWLDKRRIIGTDTKI